MVGSAVKDSINKMAGLKEVTGNAFGVPMVMYIGTAEEELRKKSRAYPELYGKSKTKLYDFVLPLAP